MQIKKTKIESEADWLSLRARNINSTEVSTLFEINPYQSLFELWRAKKNGTNIGVEETEAMSWGKRLEPVIAEETAKANLWNIIPKKDYHEDTRLRIGSSFDFEVLAPVSALLEIKNVGHHSAKNWVLDDGASQAPPHIELQIQQQMLLSNHERVFVAALIGGNRRIVFERQRDEKLIKAILFRVEWFWDTIEANKTPEPVTDTDHKLALEMKGYRVTKGHVLDATNMPTLKKKVFEMQNAKAQISVLERRVDRLRTDILMSLENAERAIGDGFKVSVLEFPETVIPPKKTPTIKKAYKRLNVTLDKEAFEPY